MSEAWTFWFAVDGCLGIPLNSIMEFYDIFMTEDEFIFLFVVFFYEIYMYIFPITGDIIYIIRIPLLLWSLLADLKPYVC